MKTIIIYLLLFGVSIVGLLVWPATGTSPPWLDSLQLLYLCILMGGLGGTTYCLRGVYLNACVYKRWDSDWHLWYYIRPIISLICGGVSYVFLRAGLLVLEANRNSDATNLGFLALAFIAGLNVDKFIIKIEDVAQATWGIEKSRTAKGVDSNGDKDI